MDNYYCIEYCPTNNDWLQIVRNHKVQQTLVISKGLEDALKRYIPSDAYLTVERQLLAYLPQYVLNEGLALNSRTVTMVADLVTSYSPVKDCGSTEYRLAIELQEPTPNSRLVDVYQQTINRKRADYE